MVYILQWIHAGLIINIHVLDYFHDTLLVTFEWSSARKQTPEYVTVRNCVVYAFYYCDRIELKVCHSLASEGYIGHLNAVKLKIKWNFYKYRQAKFWSRLSWFNLWLKHSKFVQRKWIAYNFLPHSKAINNFYSKTVLYYFIISPFVDDWDEKLLRTRDQCTFKCLVFKICFYSQILREPNMPWFATRSKVACFLIICLSQTVFGSCTSLWQWFQ